MQILTCHTKFYVEYNLKAECQYSTQIAVAKHDTVQFRYDQGPLLLTWFNFNPSMDK